MKRCENMKKYLERYIDNELKEILECMGAVLIIGPKWCGKTTTAKQFSNTIIQLQNPEKTESYLKLAEISPLTLLEGEKPLLIDEWQMAPQLWDAVRYSVDESEEYGLYILTGSTVVDETKIMHSGTGRIHRLLMKPMSLYESGDSNGKISLIDLFNKKNIKINGIKSDLTLKELVFVACRGGWPETLNIKNKNQQLIVASSYVKNICESDSSKIDGIQRNPQLVKAILASYSRHISTLAKNTKIIGDIEENYGLISKPTFYSYVNVLKRLFLIDEIEAWSPNIRSKQKIRKTAKKEFIDPSIAVASLNLSPEQLIYDLKTFGFIFETLCIRDLSIYSMRFGGNIFYYNDNNLEVDCVLQLNNGEYALIEFKLGSSEIEKGAKNLLKLDKLIKDKKLEKKISIPEPSFLAIITGGELAYTRKDGVMIIPIGTLR